MEMGSGARLARPCGAAEALPFAPGRERRERRWPALVMLVPALLVLAVLFAYPLIDIFVRSVSAPSGGALTLANYARVIERPVYVRVLVNTFQIALIVTVLTLLLGYPLAYVLSTASRRTAGILMALVLIPFFTSILVRTYAWMVILGPQGLLGQAMADLGVKGVSLLYNRAGVLIGMTYALLPYMVLTLFSVMRGIDRNLMQAAYNLGAGDWQVFRRVYLPLSLPGVVGGGLLVFILALGYFITPRLMGGDQDQMLAMVIENQVENALNWSFASALAIILLVLTLVGFALYNRVVGLRALFESKT